MLDITNRPQWYVIPGGREYIKPMIQGFADKIRLNSNISSVSRKDDSVHVHFDDGHSEIFDKVVFAASDQVVITDPSEDEKNVLSAIPYTANSVVLHTDTALLPKMQGSFASWNYLLNNNTDKAAVVTYQMNILQGIQRTRNFV